MPRRLGEKERKTGYMYFNVENVKTSMSLDEILEIIFSRGEEYRRIAREILKGIKEIAIKEDRKTLTISSGEMSKIISEKLGSRRKSMAYRVLSEFLIPMGLISYRREDGTYTVSQDFRNALIRIGTAYVRWMKR